MATTTASALALLTGNARADEFDPLYFSGQRAAADRVRLHGQREEPPIRRILKDIRSKIGKRDLWMDMYAQHATHFAGTASIDPATGEIEANVTVKVRIAGANHKQLYFMTMLPVTGVKDANGQDVPLAEVDYYGYTFAELTFSEVLAPGAEMTFTFSMAGTPECASGGTIDVNLCFFGNPTYLMMSSILLPSSISGDFATFELDVSVPAGLTIASSGVTKAVAPSIAKPGWEVHHIVQDFRTDSSSMGIAPYVVASLPMNGRKINVFTLEDSLVEETVPGVIKTMRDVIQFYSDHFGPFLFPKMDACQVTQDAGAAFGWPALLWIPDVMFLAGTGGYSTDEEEVENERYSLFAHELGHQWFPDILMNNDDMAAWLSEGFAEFSSIRFMASRLGEEYAKGVYDSYAYMYMYFVDPADDYGLTSMAAQQVSNAMVYQIVTYYKGAAVAEMLRLAIGDSAFYGAIQDLYEDYAGQEKYYNTSILQTYFEKTHGQSLSWFFNQWIYGKGFPKYEVTVTRAKGDGGKDVVRVGVKRGANIEGLTFSMPVGLAIVTQKGETVHAETIDQDVMTFTYELDSPLVRVRFDPDRTFWKRVSGALPGDLDLSGDVDAIDLLYTQWAFDSQPWGQGSRHFVSGADFDFDADVDADDLAKVTDNLGRNSDEVAR